MTHNKEKDQEQEQDQKFKNKLNAILRYRNKELINSMIEYLRLSKQYQKSYLWNNHKSSAARDLIMERDSIYYKDKDIEISFSLEITCARYTVHKYIIYHGIKKNIRFLKSFLTDKGIRY